MTRRSDRRDRGAVLVEAAVGVPLLLLAVFALIDLGLWTLNANQATNAARDGARSGILEYEFADIPGSDDWTAIFDSIQGRIDRELTPSQLTVTCVDESGTPLTGGCDNAVAGEDRIRVDVDWAWTLVTPVAGTVGVNHGSATGTATMELIGLPASEPDPATTTTTTTSTSTTTTTTTIPGSCAVVSWGVSEEPVQVKANGRLKNDLTISFTTNNAPTCVGLTASLESPSGFPDEATVVCGCGTGPNHSWTIGGNEHSFWTAGTAPLVVSQGVTDILVESVSMS